MCRFIETIRIEEGKAWYLTYHNLRMNATRRMVWGQVSELDLSKFVHPEPYRERTRCRIVYGQEIEEVSYIPYHLRAVHSLKLIDCDEAEYSLKSADRSSLDNLFARREEKDDVLIVRNGRLTDTSIANVALWNGTEWHTPSFPLLKGTHRQRLLDEGRIVERDITVDDLSLYSRVRLFNAMISFGEIEIDSKELGY